MFTLMRESSDGTNPLLYGVFAKHDAAASALESLRDAYHASGGADEDIWEAEWDIVPILDTDDA